jgi:uncharacterized repeat protein (TIGR03803 family)
VGLKRTEKEEIFVKRIGISKGPASALLAAGALLLTGVHAQAATETVLFTFVDTSTNENGGPISGLAADANGNLYGTTFGTGACSVGCGEVFKLTSNGNGQFTLSVLYSFQGSGVGDGANPMGAPILDSAGNIYGTTFAGGNGSGIVYKLTLMANGTYHETVLHTFGAFGTNDGTQPFSTLVFDKQGNLYGTTNQGGGGASNTFCQNGCGTVFKLSPNSNGPWTETVIHSFPGMQGSTDGQNPHGGVIFDAAGNLWGTTENGGNMRACVRFEDVTGCGTVFKLTEQSNGQWEETTLFKFAGQSTGFNPWDGLVIDKAGNLYGMTTNGGNASGTVFEVTPTSSGVTEKVIHSFTNGNDGSNPFNGLTIDASGNLYGTVDFGGPTDHGIVFKLTPNGNGTWTEDVLYAFTGGTDGADPMDDRVVVDSAGNVFGTTFNGGDFGLCTLGCGVVFEVTQ